MAKRFTDTDKWKKPWFRKLSPKLKLVWNYVCDNCDHAGVWPADFDLMSFQIGEKITEREFLAAFSDKALPLDGGKFFIQPFVEFQYGELNPNNKAHQGVLKVLKSLAPCMVLGKALTGSSQGPQDKEQDKDKDKELEREGGLGETQSLEFPVEDRFETFWEKYPRKVQKSDARQRFRRMIKSEPDFALLVASLEKFLSYHRRKGTEGGYIPHAATFLGVEKHPAWRDWLESDAGLETDFKASQGKPDLSQLKRFEEADRLAEEERVRQQAAIDAEWAAEFGPRNESA